MRQRKHPQLQGKLICPHCQATGYVSTKKVKVKVGVHGGTVTAAVLTGGISMLGTGLSLRHEKTEANCSNCKSSWLF